MDNPMTPEEIVEIRRKATERGQRGVILSKREILGLLAAFDEVVGVANEYYFDLRQHVGDYQWDKHWAGDAEKHSWLNKVTDRSRG